MDETTLVNIYNAYNEGRMTDQESAEYEADLASGAISMPQGEAPVQSNILDAGIVEAYRSGAMTQEEVTELEEDIKSGQWVMPEEEVPVMDKIGDVFTGNLRTTEEVYALPDWGAMPELNSFSMKSFKSALGTMATSPEETIQVIQANFPQTKVRQDANGNFIMQSSLDGAEYAIKPGFQMSDIPRAVSGVASFTPAGRAKTLMGQTLGAAGTQAAIEGSQKLTGGDFDTAEVALAGGLGTAGDLAGKGARAIKGSISPSAKSTALKEAVNQADNAGISTSTSDVFPPQNFASKWVQSTSEKIPVVGTGGMREAQQETRVQAVKDLFESYGATSAANISDDVMLDLTKKRSADLTKYSELKNGIIQKLSGVGEVPVEKTIKAIDDEISNLQSLNTQGVTPVIKMLEDYKGAFRGQDLSNVEALRKQLGEQLKAPELASVRSAGEKSAGKVYSALRDDMTDFIKVHGDKNDYTKWMVGNKRLSQMIGELDSSALKSTLKNGDATPEAVRRMLFSKKPSEVAALSKGLTQEGKANARTAIMQEILEKSGGIDNVSTDKFISQLKKQSAPIQGFFKGDDLEAIKGLTKALEITRRASDSTVSPATGVQLAIPVGAAVLTDLMGGAGAGIATAGTLGSAARIYESKPVRNLLIKIADAEKGKETAIINQLVKVLQVERQTQSEESE